MKFQSFTRRLLSGTLAFSLFTGAVLPAARADLWQTSKDYTAAIAKGAADAGAAAAAAAAAAVKAAQADLARAQAALAAAKAGPSLVIIGNALGSVARAEAALAAAESAYAAAVAAAEALAAIAAGVAIGTALGQGINWLFSGCYDKGCDLTPDNGEAFAYAVASQEEVDALIPALAFIGTGVEVSVDQFDPQTYALVSTQVRMFLGMARGAAAYTEGMPSGVLAAVTDLKGQLASLPNQLLLFSEHLEQTKFMVPQMEEIKFEFSNAIKDAQAQLLEGRNLPGVNPEEVDLAIEKLGDAYAAFIDADNKIGEVVNVSLVGAEGLLGNLTVEDYDRFLEDCATQGKECLPSSEIQMVERLIEAAGVHSPTMDFGTEIARWDAFYGDNTQERAILESYGEIGVTPAELFRNSVIERSKEGTWMNIDLEKSPLTVWARSELAKDSADQPESGGGCSLSVADPISTSFFGSLLLAFSGLFGAYGWTRRRKASR